VSPIHDDRERVSRSRSSRTPWPSSPTAPPSWAWRHRAERHCRDGRQGDALQGIRRRRCLPDLPGDEGRGQDRRDGQAGRAGVRRDHLEDIAARAASTSRSAPEGPGHPRLPRRPARYGVVVLAALLNALRIVKKDLRRCGRGDGSRRRGDGDDQDPHVERCARHHRRGRAARSTRPNDGHGLHEAMGRVGENPRQVKGDLGDALVRADVFIGLSVPASSRSGISTDGPGSIVFAMANPEPEIRRRKLCGTCASWRPGAPTFPTRSTMSCASRVFPRPPRARARSVTMR